MSATDAGEAATATPGLDRVDELLVVMALRRVSEPLAGDAFVVRAGAPPGEGVDERRLLAVIAELVGSLGAGTLWSLDVARRHEGVGASPSTGSRADVRLDLVAPSGDLPTVLAQLGPLVAELRGVLPAVHRALGREEAIAVALDLVARVWGGGAELQVSDEEHHAEQGTWAIGLVDADVARYEVTVGLVDGDPHTAHLRRRAATEVADSIGESG